MRVLVVSDDREVSRGSGDQGFADRVRHAFQDSYRRCFDSVQFAVREPAGLSEFLYDPSIGCSDPVGLQRFKALDCVLVQTRYSAAWLPTNRQLRQLLVQVVLHSKPCMLFSGAFFSFAVLLASKGLRFSVFAQGHGVARLNELTALAPVINVHDLYLDLSQGDLWRKSHEFGGWRKTANLGLRSKTRETRVSWDERISSLVLSHKRHWLVRDVTGSASNRPVEIRLPKRALETTHHLANIPGLEMIGNYLVSLRDVVVAVAAELTADSHEVQLMLRAFVDKIVGHSGEAATPGIPDGKKLLELDMPVELKGSQSSAAAGPGTPLTTDLRLLKPNNKNTVYQRTESLLLKNPLYGNPGRAVSTAPSSEGRPPFRPGADSQEDTRRTRTNIEADAEKPELAKIFDRVHVRPMLRSDLDLAAWLKANAPARQTVRLATPNYRSRGIRSAHDHR